VLRKRELYNATWPEEASDLEIEQEAIRRGGEWKGKKGQTCGLGLSFHYEKMREILWPTLDDHRWHRLCRDTIINSKVTVLMGSASSGKTHEASWLFLCEYLCFPEETCVLVSSTHIDGLRLRVWAEITMLWEKAVQKFPHLPGNLIDSKLLIATDNITENDVDEERMARDWRKGIKGVPCIQNGKFIGLSKFQGIKQKRMRLIADEAQLMGPTFLSAFANLDKNEDFKAVILGNPNETADPLGKAAEPKEGWAGHMEPSKTAVWDTKFMNGRCVNLVGTDSPNFDADTLDKYKYLINAKKIANTLSFFPKDSVEYYSNCIGVMKVGILSRRIVDEVICARGGAQDDAIWADDRQTIITALDAAYGGDRCITGHAKFGEARDGGQILQIFPPVKVPVLVRTDMTAEDQISVFVKQYCEGVGCPPANFFHDSTGRGSLGTSLARTWSSDCDPVEFGGRPTKRPVSLDLFIVDEETKERRHKRCDEHYDYFVAELAFSVRYVIEGKQMRNLPTDVMDELCLRKWDKVRGDKISVEPKSGTPTKPGFKQRVGYSPDLADWCFRRDTKVLTPQGNVVIQSLKPGDEVVTPFGITRVAIVRESWCDFLTTVSFSNGKKLTGRGEHRVFVSKEGWKRLDGLSIDIAVQSVYDLPLWNILNLFFTKDESIGFKQLADIIKTKTGMVRLRDFYTDASGMTILGLFQRVCASITKMVTGRIMTFLIWNWWKFQSTLAIICVKGLKTRSKEPKCCWDSRWLKLLRLLGIIPLKDMSGTAETPLSNGGNTDVKVGRSAWSVASLFSHTFPVVQSPCAQSVAKTDGLYGRPKLTIGTAWSAVMDLLRTNIFQRKVVPLAVDQFSPPEPKKVYNLTLERHNAYYANGILVENCAIIVEGARRRGFDIKKLGVAKEGDVSDDYFQTEADEYAQAIKEKLLAR
jgi:hypothetical protein